MLFIDYRDDREVRWDLLPSGRQLGGALANFAYCADLLESQGVVAGRVGRDSQRTLKQILGDT